MNQDRLEQLAQQAYDEARALRERSGMEEVVGRMTILYGPPLLRSDLALISFQGGGGDPSPSPRTWPPRLLYLDDTYRFGRKLRRHFAAAGLSGVLESSTVALAAVFPEAPARDAAKWMARKGPRAEWRSFSSGWVRRLLLAMRPRVILVFGKNASVSLGIEDEWRDEMIAARRGRVFARGRVYGAPAVYCHHLSQGCKDDEVARCLDEIGLLVDVRGPNTRSAHRDHSKP